MVYWPLMKGLLAGKLPRDSQLDQRDSRRKYPMYQGDEWQKNQDFVDRLREIAAISGHTIAQLVVNWTFSQSGITSALCGAKRPEQIEETAGAMGWSLSARQREIIDEGNRSRVGSLKNKSVANHRLNCRRAQRASERISLCLVHRQHANSPRVSRLTVHLPIVLCATRERLPMKPSLLVVRPQQSGCLRNNRL